MKWPWEKETEHRAGLTDLLVQHITDTAGGASAVPDGLAALEIASGLWGRAFSSAKVEGEGLAQRSITPSVLEMIGRQLVRRGEVVFEIVVTRGGLTLRPCADWSVSGGPDPDSWVYLVSIPGPSTTISKTISGERVIHVRYAADPLQPWQGRSPIAIASATTKVGANLELRLGQELSSQVGTLLPVPGDPSDDNKYATLKTQLGALKGKTAWSLLSQRIGLQIRAGKRRGVSGSREGSGAIHGADGRHTQQHGHADTGSLWGTREPVGREQTGRLYGSLGDSFWWPRSTPYPSWSSPNYPTN